jgi:hypothetical protein
MKATVYYVRLTDAQRDDINANGWNCPVGMAYHRAKAGVVGLDNFDLFELAATMEAKDAEEVWLQTQNGVEPWFRKNGIVRHATFPRSMDVGDIIVWEDGSRERCAPVGFKKVV